MNDRGLFDQEASFSFNKADDSSWLRHSKTLDTLWQPLTPSADRATGVSCGTMSFAAVARMKFDVVARYFPESEAKPWINRTMMEKALRTSGRRFDRRQGQWPEYGLCLVHFVGPWTERGYPMAILPHTHWIAVDRDYVYDVNWNGWLPKANWEEIVLEQLLAIRPRATGWQVMTSYELFECLTPDELDLWAGFSI
jgi:hypothetical protein